MNRDLFGHKGGALARSSDASVFPVRVPHIRCFTIITYQQWQTKADLKVILTTAPLTLKNMFACVFFNSRQVQTLNSRY